MYLASPTHIDYRVFRRRRNVLSLSEGWTIHLLNKQRSALEVVHIVAPKGNLVHLWFSYIKYAPTRRPWYNFHILNNCDHKQWY